MNERVDGGGGILFILFINENICSEHALEPSNEESQTMFSLRNKVNYVKIVHFTLH